MQRFRLPLRALVVLAVISLALPIALYGLARTSWAAQKLSTRLSSALDWPVHVDHLAVGAWSAPWVELDGITVASAATAGGPPLIDINHLRVAMPWRTLFGRATHLDELRLRAPVAHLRVDAAGAQNWSAFVDRMLALKSGAPFTWTVSSLHVEAGGADYRDARSGSAVLVTGIILELRDFRPNALTPVEFRLAGDAEPHTFHVVLKGDASFDFDHNAYAARDLHCRGWIGGGTLPLAGVELASTVGSARADLAQGTATADDVHFEGMGIRAQMHVRAEAIGQQPVLSFALETDPFKPRQVGYALNASLPATADPKALGSARLAVTGRWGPDGLELAPLAGEVDDSHFSGSLVVPVGGGVPRLRLHVDKLDVDRYRAPAAPVTETPGAIVAGLLEQLKSVDADAVLTVGEARAAGAVARDLRVVIESTPADGKAAR